MSANNIAASSSITIDDNLECADNSDPDDPNTTFLSPRGGFFIDDRNLERGAFDRAYRYQDSNVSTLSMLH